MSEIIFVGLHSKLSTDKTELREKLAVIESAMMESAQKIEIKVTHYFSNGVYAREIFIPKGSIVMGKIHKFQNLNIMSKGKGKIISIDGAKEIEAPYAVVSSPGVKRFYHALEDTVWTTILGTEKKDPEQIEEEFIAKSYDEVIAIEIQEDKLLTE
jgi:hypothetical protein